MTPFIDRASLMSRVTTPLSISDGGLGSASNVASTKTALNAAASLDPTGISAALLALATIFGVGGPSKKDGLTKTAHALVDAYGPDYITAASQQNLNKAAIEQYLIQYLKRQSVTITSAQLQKGLTSNTLTNIVGGSNMLPLIIGAGALVTLIVVMKHGR